MSDPGASIIETLLHGTEGERRAIQEQVTSDDPPIHPKELTDQILDALPEPHDPKNPSGRAWLLSTLGLIAANDSAAREQLVVHVGGRHEKNHGVRHYALVGLYRGGAENILDTALGKMNSSVPEVRLLAHAILTDVGDDKRRVASIEILRKALHGGERETAAAVRSLRTVPVPELRDDVAQLLNHSDEQVRADAAEVLARMEAAEEPGAAPQADVSALVTSEQAGDLSSDTPDGEEGSYNVWLAEIESSWPGWDREERPWGAHLSGRAAKLLVGVQLGDVVIMLARSEQPGLAGATMVSEWGPDLASLSVMLELPRSDESEVALDDLRSAVPKLDYWTNPGPLTPVTQWEWSVIREIMTRRGVVDPTRLPIASAPPTRRLELANHEIGSPWDRQSVVRETEPEEVTFSVRNAGNVTLEAGARWRLDAVIGDTTRSQIYTQDTPLLPGDVHSFEFSEAPPPLDGADPVDVTWRLWHEHWEHSLLDPLAYTQLIPRSTPATSEEAESVTRLIPGQEGPQVRRLQDLLAEAGYASGPNEVDGVYGPKTRSAVGKFQRSIGLPTDGIAGPETIAALEEELSKRVDEPAAHGRAPTSEQVTDVPVGSDDLEPEAAPYDEAEPSVAQPTPTAEDTPSDEVDPPTALPTEAAAQSALRDIDVPDATEAPPHTAPSVDDAPLVDGAIPQAPAAGEQPAAPAPADSTVSVSPPAGTTTTQESRVVVLMRDYQALDEQDDAARVELDISGTTATLTYANEPYVSRVTLDQAALGSPLGDPRTYGEKLFAAVVNDNADGGYSSTATGYDTAVTATGGRFRLEMKVDPPLQHHGWEYMVDPRRGELSVHEAAPVYRRVGAERPPRPDAKPLRVLFAIASPEGIGPGAANKTLRTLAPLNVRREIQIAETALRPLERDGLVDARILAPNGETVTLDAINEALQEFKPHVFHLVAHGFYLPAEEGAGEEYYLAIDDEKDKPPRVEATRLNLTGSSELRLAILATCQSLDTDSGNAPLGQVLIERHVPAVVAMLGKLDQRSGQGFTQYFYNYLARTGRVDMAMAATRFFLKENATAGYADWGFPILALGASDGRLFEVDEQRAERLPDFEPRLLSEAELADDDALPDAELSRQIREAVQTPETLTPQTVRRLVETAEATHRDRRADLAPQQDRAAIRKNLRVPVHVESAALRRFVEHPANGGLDLAPSVHSQVASALNAGKHIVLIGPPGTGKTTLAQAICDFAAELRFSMGTLPTTASADWTTFDTVGGYVPTTAQTLEFRPGVFLQAIAEAKWMAVDEINRADIDKAVGELFTVLSGQRVALPYRVSGHPVRIVPGEDDPKQNWVPIDAQGPYDYVVHPSWRIVASMNVYDKSSLFAMSYAFMRRFAFVDVGIPAQATFEDLRRRWVGSYAGGLPTRYPGAPPLDDAALQRDLDGVFDPSSVLMRARELGPAIAKDMIHFVIDRHAQSGTDVHELVGEAFLLYALPQLDGLDRGAIQEVYRHLQALFPEGSGSMISARIRDLYPHIPDLAWEVVTPETAGDGEN